MKHTGSIKWQRMKFTKERIGFGNAIPRAWMTTSFCLMWLKFLDAIVVTSTKLSYPLFLLLQPAYHNSNINLLFPHLFQIFPRKKERKKTNLMLLVLPETNGLWQFYQTNYLYKQYWFFLFLLLIHPLLVLWALQNKECFFFSTSFCCCSSLLAKWLSYLE